MFWPDFIKNGLFHPQMERLLSPGVQLFESCIGEHEFERQGIRDKLKIFRPFLQNLCEVEDSQIEHSFKKSCFGICEFSFFLRNTKPCTKSAKTLIFDAVHWQKLDEAARRALSPKQFICVFFQTKSFFFNSALSGNVFC